MASQKFTAKQVADAIRECQGFVTKAAGKLDCSVATIYNYVNRYQSVQEARDESREAMLDFAEGKLLSLIRKGNVAATIFFLKTQGKSRGYIERQEVDSKQVSLNIDMGTLTMQQVERIANGEDPKIVLATPGVGGVGTPAPTGD